MSTPLPFILYSLWGRIFTFNIVVLRAFSMVVALVAYLLFYTLVYSLTNDTKMSLLATGFVVINPYMIGLSVFVFTDMLAILFIIISCLSIQKQNAALLSLSLAGSLLCRQYMFFFVLAIGLYYLWKYFLHRDRESGKMLFACVVSMTPLLALVLLWRGLSPVNELRNLYLDEKTGFHPGYFTLYVCQLFIYLAPVILIYWKSFYSDLKTVLFSVVASGFYWAFPVRANKYQIDINTYTVGFFHKFIDLIFKNQFAEDVVFFTAFLLGIPVVIFVIKDIYQRWQRREAGFELLLDLSIIAFLLIMPFSYLVWEKYFLPLLPIVMMRILLLSPAKGTVVYKQEL
jgi:hypothetical protein